MKHAAIALLVAATLLSACAPPPPIGTWKVEKLETLSPGQQGATVTNVGTITFKKDNTGSKDLHYNSFGMQHDDTSTFSWSAGEKSVTIKGGDSDFTKTWLVQEDDKNHQRWQSTNGRGQVQTMELSR